MVGPWPPDPIRSWRSGGRLCRGALKESSPDPAVTEGRPLGVADGPGAGRAERDHGVEAVAAERRLLAAGLDLDDRPGAGHDEVQVHVGVAVLDVTQVQQSDAAEQA